MPTEKHRFMVYLSDEDMEKLEKLQGWMFADSWSEVVRRLVRESYDRETKQRESKTE